MVSKERNHYIYRWSIDNTPIYMNRMKSIGHSIGKLKSKPIEFNGVEYSSVRALSKHLGIAYETIRSRIKMGIPLDKKVTYGSR